jgi:hypothetical protein
MFATPSVPGVPAGITPPDVWCNSCEGGGKLFSCAAQYKQVWGEGYLAGWNGGKAAAANEQAFKDQQALNAERQAERAADEGAYAEQLRAEREAEYQRQLAAALSRKADAALNRKAGAGQNLFPVDLAKESPTEAPAAEDNTALYVGLGLVAILAAAWALSSKKG